jgi:hypothetical protein
VFFVGEISLGQRSLSGNSFIGAEMNTLALTFARNPPRITAKKLDVTEVLTAFAS